MRLFVALDLTPEVREKIAALVAKLCAAYRDARWVRADNLHVTLKFIGEIDESRVTQFRAELSELHSPQPARMEFGGTGFFPSDKRPRVFWIGIHSSANVAELARELDERFAPLGVERETREFKPHLTLARFDEPRSLDKLRAAIDSERNAEFGSVLANQLHLYQSQTGPGGSRYTRLASFTFAPGEIA